jgi:hypothetical protein
MDCIPKRDSFRPLMKSLSISEAKRRGVFFRVFEFVPGEEVTLGYWQVHSVARGTKSQRHNAQLHESLLTLFTENNSPYIESNFSILPAACRDSNRLGGTLCN